MTDYGLPYGATRERVTTLLRGLDHATAATPVGAARAGPTGDPPSYLSLLSAYGCPDAPLGES